jgi:hypothetical protein
MNHRPHTALIAIVAAVATDQATADVRDTSTERALSLPSGAPALVVKRNDWVISREQRRPGDTAVYYMLTSEATQLVLSVYIDKSTACQSSESCLAEALKNQSYKEAKEQRAFEAGPFKAAQFYLDQPLGKPIKQAHVLAAAYLDGHWFDVHISKSGQERPDIIPLVELLKNLSVR